MKDASITMTLTEREQQALGWLIDTALKASGIAGYDAAGLILRKMSEAKMAADAEAKPSNVVQMQAGE